MFNNKVQAVKSKLPPGSAMAIKKNIPSASSNMSASQRLRTGFNKARGTGSSATYKSMGSI